ncbi:MAG: hydrogen peroxide-inducible genes activator [Alistipes sp.]|nr:hydrogen peroxide-inducible genes activator [Alistipes sp.]
MTIVQIEYLLAVANCGSFSQASERCFVTQPSLSMQIKNLEEELGVILLDRSKKPVIPTEAGTVVIESAREALKAYNYIKESVNELKGEVSGTLRLGVIPSIAPYLLHRFISGFVRKYPKVELEIREMKTADIITNLSRDSLDAAILAGGMCPDNIIEEDLFNDRFFAYVAPSNPLFERSNIRIEDIDMKELLLLSDGHCLRDQILELCQSRRAVRPSCNFESGSLDTLMRIVDCTSGITIIPEMAVEFIPRDRKNQLKTLAKGAASRKISIAVRRTYVKRTLIEALKESVIEAAPLQVN